MNIMHRAPLGANPVFVHKYPRMGFYEAEAPQGFGSVVASDKRTFRADPRRFHAARPVEPVELEIEREIGVRRGSTEPDYRLMTLVRRGDLYVWERAIVALPTLLLRKPVSEGLARAYFEKATTFGCNEVSYSNEEEEFAEFAADRFELGFHKNSPYAVQRKGEAHIYYRTVEDVSPERWVWAAANMGELYDGFAGLSERYSADCSAKRILAETLARRAAVVVEASK